MKHVLHLVELGNAEHVVLSEAQSDPANLLGVDLLLHRVEFLVFVDLMADVVLEDDS